MRCFWDERQRAHRPREEFFNGGLHPAAFLSVAGAVCYAFYSITTRILAAHDPEPFALEDDKALFPPYYLALIHLALGEHHEALAYLEKAYDEHDGSLPLLKVDRRLDPLRPEPALRHLLARLGLAD